MWFDLNYVVLGRLEEHTNTQIFENSPIRLVTTNHYQLDWIRHHLKDKSVGTSVNILAREV